MSKEQNSERSRELDLEAELRGRTLRVYFELLSTKGPVGPRELQRKLGLSSPSLAAYHLDKLVDLKLVRRERGEYTVEEVVQEIETLEARSVYFVDDNIAANRRRARELFRALKPLGIAWTGLINMFTGKDGELLEMSTTQQRWLAHSVALYLVYTRKAAHNANVMRWRARLYLAEVDPERLCLIRETEQEVFPLIGDGIDGPDHVARMGNFMPVNATVEESWVTVGETLPSDGWKGDTLLSRIRWTRPNYELAWRTV